MLLTDKVYARKGDLRRHHAHYDVTVMLHSPLHIHDPSEGRYCSIYLYKVISRRIVDNET